jgi:hypothetical protein
LDGETGFFANRVSGGNKTDIRATLTPKKPGFSQKPGFCWGQKRVGEAQAACNIAQKLAKALCEKPGFLHQYLRQNKKIPLVGWVERSGTQQIGRVPLKIKKGTMAPFPIPHSQFPIPKKR